jgi:electron transport complex protein RnfE
MKTIYNGIIKENPTFVLLLGLCPALAVTKTVESAYLMGICVLVILMFSSFIISLIRKLVTDSVRIPVYILIIGTFVTIVEVLLKEYIPNLYVVNCIVLGRAMVVASKEKPIKSILDAFGIGIGFTLAISLIALIREVLGTNTITLMDSISSFTGYKAIYTNILPNTDIFPISVFTTSTGAFLTLAFLIALFNKIKGGKKNESN